MRRSGSAFGAGSSKPGVKTPQPPTAAKVKDPFSFDESEDATHFEEEEKAKPKIVVPEKAREAGTRLALGAVLLSEEPEVDLSPVPLCSAS